MPDNTGLVIYDELIVSQASPEFSGLGSTAFGFVMVPLTYLPLLHDLLCASTLTSTKGTSPRYELEVDEMAYQEGNHKPLANTTQESAPLLLGSQLHLSQGVSSTNGNQV